MNYLLAYKNMIIGGVFCALVIFCFIQTYRINSYKAELAKSTAQIAILGNSIEIQNNSLKKLSEDDAKRVAIASEAIKKEKAISSYRLGKINKLQSDLGKPQSCEEAVKEVKGQL